MQDFPSATWPDLAGRLLPDGAGHVLPVRIYFEDTDFSGVVYHANYLRFMERGRSDYIRLIGVGHAELASGEHGEALAFAVRRIRIDYFRPARIDDLVEVETRPGDIRGASIVLRQVVRRGDEKLVEADVTVVMINLEGRARRIPDTLRRALGAPVE
ncbi:MAG: tol-pal system-associated acyl-CoA thioesterase [Rhizobiales bacterium]|nr:tol-pal system-associated acyl-CoA thioesterase [Hyphomicrobiales bacterium]MBN9008563.1 tol-pal system-associated acyl-CoA thioesterase [Hyphomicrobiales bacterium]